MYILKSPYVVQFKSDMYCEVLAEQAPIMTATDVTVGHLCCHKSYRYVASLRYGTTDIVLWVL